MVSEVLLTFSKKNDDMKAHHDNDNLDLSFNERYVSYPKKYIVIAGNNLNVSKENLDGLCLI